MLPPVNGGIVRVQYSSTSSIHSTARFVLHYNTINPSLFPRPCAGLYFNGTTPYADWNHVAATAELVNETSTRLKIYVEGTLQVFVDAHIPIPVLAVSGSAGISVGRGDPSRAPPLLGPFAPSDGGYGNEEDLHQGAETFWAGGLDEMRVWNVSRTAEQIASGIFRTCNSTEFQRDDSDNIPILCLSFDNFLQDSDGKAYFKDLSPGEASRAIPVVGDTSAPWCTTRDDGGVLVSEVK